MAQILAGIKSKFILSINDHPDIREVFQAFNIHLNIFCCYTQRRNKLPIRPLNR